MAHPKGFQGTMTALVTPLHDGALDEDALRRLVAQQLAGGVDVLVPCGTTGEGATLTPDESVRVIRICVEEARAGAGGGGDRIELDPGDDREHAAGEGGGAQARSWSRPTTTSPSRKAFSVTSRRSPGRAGCR